MNLWKDVILTKDLVNLKEDGVLAKVAIDVKKGRKKKRYTEAIDFREQYHLSKTTTMEAKNE